MVTISAPERRRSLGMRWQELHRHDDGRVRGEPQDGEVLVGEMQGHGFLEVLRHVIQRAALSDDLDLEAFRHISRLLARADHRLDRVLEHRRPPYWASV